MTLYPTLRRAATVAVAAAIALVALAAPAAAAPQKFYADSGDRCVYGHTEGTLTWRTDTPSINPTVYVEGALTDEPAGLPPTACAVDRMYSVASYIGYAGRTVVDSTQVRADNAAVAVRDVLGDRTFTPIDRVVVQVCRFSTSPVGISYCGSPQTYTPSRA